MHHCAGKNSLKERSVSMRPYTQGDQAFRVLSIDTYSTIENNYLATRP